MTEFDPSWYERIKRRLFPSTFRGWVGGGKIDMDPLATICDGKWSGDEVTEKNANNNEAGYKVEYDPLKLKMAEVKEQLKSLTKPLFFGHCEARDPHHIERYGMSVEQAGKGVCIFIEGGAYSSGSHSLDIEEAYRLELALRDFRENIIKINRLRQEEQTLHNQIEMKELQARMDKLGGAL